MMLQTFGNRRHVENERWLDAAGVDMTATGTMRLRSAQSKRVMKLDNMIYRRQEPSKLKSRKKSKAKVGDKRKKSIDKKRKSEVDKDSVKQAPESPVNKYRLEKPINREGMTPIEVCEGHEPPFLYNIYSSENMRLQKMHALLAE